MIFSSLLFLSIFLVAVLALYYVIPNRTYRNIVLCVASLFFYAWGEPVCVILMIFSILMNYAAGLLMGKYRRQGKPGRAKAALVVSIVLNLLMLGLFKYTPLVFDTLKAVIPSLRGMATPVAKDILYKSLANVIPALEKVKPFGVEGMLPIGISFYTFQAMSYVIDVYRGDTGVQKNPMLFGTYVALFPQLIAGPIVRYKDIEDQLLGRKESIDQFASGVKLFTVGLAKKILIANQMAVLWNGLRADYAGNGALGSWVGIIAYTLQIYFDFAGYSDMAIGLGRMFGFEFRKNFDYPYISSSVTEFWRRWHISLSVWFRDYVYIPLGGNRKGMARQILNLCIVWALTGLWHGASWNFVLWGLWHGFFVVMEKLFLTKVLKKTPKPICHVYALLIATLGWALFDFTDLTQLFGFLGSLFSGGFVSHDALTLILSYLPLLIVAAIASTPLMANIRHKFDGKVWAEYMDIGLILIALVFCIASLVASGYNPFIYLRF